MSFRKRNQYVKSTTFYDDESQVKLLQGGGSLAFDSGSFLSLTITSSASIDLAAGSSFDIFEEGNYENFSASSNLGFLNAAFTSSSGKFTVATSGSFDLGANIFARADASPSRAVAEFLINSVSVYTTTIGCHDADIPVERSIGIKVFLSESDSVEVFLTPELGTWQVLSGTTLNLSKFGNVGAIGNVSFGTGHTTVNTFSGSVTVAAGTDISVANSSNIITISNTQTPVDSLNSFSGDVTITAGDNITIVNDSGDIAISSSGGGGSVTGSGDFFTDNDLAVGGALAVTGALHFPADASTPEFSHIIADTSHLILSSSAGSTVTVSGSLLITDPSTITTRGPIINDSADLVLSSSAGSTIVASGSLLASGTAASPAFGGLSDSSSGMYFDGSNIRFSRGGTNTLVLSSATVSTVGNVAFLTRDGTPTVAGFGFSGDSSTGIYKPTSQTIGLTLGGTEYARLNTSAFLLSASIDLPLDATANSAHIIAENSYLILSSSVGSTVYVSGVLETSEEIQLQNNQPVKSRLTNGTSVSILNYDSSNITKIGANEEIALGGDAVLQPTSRLELDPATETIVSGSAFNSALPLAFYTQSGSHLVGGSGHLILSSSAGSTIFISGTDLLISDPSFGFDASDINNPTLNFASGDAITYGRSADRFAFSIGSVARLSVTSTGIGVGTSSPNHGVTLYSDQSATGVSLNNTTDITTNFERGVIRFNSDIFEFVTEAGGTGVNRDLRIAPSGTLILSASDGYNISVSSSLNFPVDAAAASANIIAENSYLILSSSVGSVVHVSGALGLENGSQIHWADSVRFSASANGRVVLTDDAGTTFGGIQLGGTTNAYPALWRNSNTLQARVADNSAYAPFQSGRITISNDANPDDGNFVADAGHMILSCSAGSTVTVSGALKFVDTDEIHILSDDRLIMSSSVGFVACSGNFFVVSDAGSIGARLVNEASTPTNPTVCPNGASATTGVGGGGGQVSLIASSTEALRCTNSQALFQLNVVLSSDVDLFINQGSITDNSGDLILSSSASSIVSLSSSLKLQHLTEATLPAGSTELSGAVVWLTDTKRAVIYGPEGWNAILTGSL